MDDRHITIEGFAIINLAHPELAAGYDNITFYLERDDAEQLTLENDDVVVPATLTYQLRL